MISKIRNYNIIRVVFYILLFASTFIFLNYAKYISESGGTEDLSSIELVKEEDGGIEIVDNNYFTFNKRYSINPEKEINKDKRVVEENNNDEVKAVYYTVKKGDTLYEIAKAIGQDIDVIVANNPEVKDGKIFVNQKLKILSENSIEYTVKKGDTLIEISKKYEVKLADILLKNNLDDTRIYVGQKLFLQNPNLDAVINPERYEFNRKYRDFKVAMKWPIRFEGVTSPFGQRFHPVLKKYIIHKGVDLRAGNGTNLYAPEDGKIIFANYMSGYGRLIKIKHSDGYSTRMAHLSKIYVKNGQTVKSGDLIGKTGQSGRVTGPHLHFEVRKNGVALDPMRFR